MLCDNARAISYLLSHCNSKVACAHPLGPMVIFMRKHLELAGCPFPPTAIQCFPCPPDRAGGFHPEHGVLLCQDQFMSKKHMEETMAHEMIHAFDHCRFKVDWNNLRHHACSEVGHTALRLQDPVDEFHN
jgi:hypothetical protein